MVLNTSILGVDINLQRIAASRVGWIEFRLGIVSIDERAVVMNIQTLTAEDMLR